MKSITQLIFAQPNWSDVDRSRVKWELRRVGRSIKREERTKIFTELHILNAQLEKCLLARPYTVTDLGTRGVDEVRQRFNDKNITATRQNAALLHKTISASWGCSCVEPHSGNILLNWHGAKRHQLNSFSLAFPPSGPSTSRIASIEKGWEFVSVCVRKSSLATALNAPPDLLPVAQDGSRLPNVSQEKPRLLNWMRPRSPSKASIALELQRSRSMS